MVNKEIKDKYARGEITREEYLRLKNENTENKKSAKELASKNRVQEEKIILGHFKPRFFIILATIIATLIGAYLFVQNFTPSHISSMYSASIQDFIGNGESSYQIPVSLTSNLNTPISGTSIQASTNEGSVSGCITDNTGSCDIIFTPPKQATPSYANITLTVGDITKTILVKVAPDPTARLTLSSTDYKLPADGSSSTAIIVLAYDNQGSPVPDGTQVTLSLSGSGSLSSTSCATVNGKCQVTYTASIFPGNVTVSATSYNATASINITLQPLNPSSISLTALNNSINGNGYSTTIITAKVTNKLGNPVRNTKVLFYTNEGDIQNYCTTGSSGSCSVVYTAPNLAGQATISAYVYSNSSIFSNITISLLPTTSLSVQFAMTPYIGNPIVPAFAINTAYLQTNMTTIEISNSGSGTFTGTVTLQIPSWSSPISQEITISPGSSIILHLNPPLNSQVFSNLQAQPVTYQLTIIDSKGNVVYQNSYPANLTSFNTMDWFGGLYDNLISAWVQPTAPAIHQLLANASLNLPGKAMVGYIETYPYGCGLLGLSPCNASETTNLQLQAIYNQLQSEGMHYVNAPADFYGTQTVYTPVQSLAAGGENCIDGSLVFASATVAIGMQTYIARVPGHAFVCVQTTSNSNIVDCIETTMIGDGTSFSQAESTGDTEFEYYKNKGELELINVNQVLGSGVKELPAN